MAVIKALASHVSVKAIIRYVTREDKTNENLVSAYHCSPYSAAEEMEVTKQLYGKTGGRTYAHYIQSFAPGEDVTPEKVHAIARQWAEQNPKFKGFEMLLATHTDKDHIHTHFIINSVCLADGHKFHVSAKELQAMKELSEQICVQNGLRASVVGSHAETSPIHEVHISDGRKYQLLRQALHGQGQSYLLQTAMDVEHAVIRAKNREEFCQRLKEKGYRTIWTDNRKYLTFIDAEGNRVRNCNLEKTFGMQCSKEFLTGLFDMPELERRAQQEALRRKIIQTGVQCREERNQLQNSQKELRLRMERAKQEQQHMEQQLHELDQKEAHLCMQMHNPGIVRVFRRPELKEELSHIEAERECIREYTGAILEECGLSEISDMETAEKQLLKMQDQIRMLETADHLLEEIIQEDVSLKDSRGISGGMEQLAGELCDDMDELAHGAAKLNQFIKKEAKRQEMTHRRRI